MTVDVVDSRNEKVGALEVSDEVFGGRVNTDVIWEAVVHQLASERRGTAATKTRGKVSGTGKKPWRQKGTGRARVGEARNPLWRGGGVVFGPHPRSYAYPLPKKVIRGGLRAALTQKFKEEGILVVDQLSVEEPRTRHATELLNRLDLSGKTLFVDVKPDANLALAVRNISGIRISSTNQVSARDVVDAGRVVMTRAALERLEQVLAS
ncbi:MAG: 50S ribosomal protein L4 [Vicinamibacterales bacterium]|nr:50S ribosomal protein L4 [Vicinamibacterales bacterium]